MDDTNQLIDQRRKNLAALHEAGIDPFANKFTPSEGCGTSKENYAEGRNVAVAGRLVSKREMGKTVFAHVRDVSGTIQLFIRKNDVGEEAFKVFKGLDLRSEEHTSELQSRRNLVCRLLLEKKNPI